MKAKEKLEFWVKKLLRIIFVRLSTNKYYSTIEDLPVHNWWKIHETKDVSHLLISKRDLNNYEKEFLSIIWENVNDQYLKAFGLGEEMQKIIEKERHLILMYEDKWVNGNRDVMTFIEIEENELAEARKKLIGTENDFYQMKAKLETIIKFSIDIKKVCVKEYYSYFKVLEAQANDGK